MKTFDMATLVSKGYRVGQLKTNKEWSKACKAASSSTSIREWLEHVSKLLTIAQFSRCEAASFDTHTGKPVTFKWVTQSHMSDFRHVIHLDVRKGGRFADFLKPSQDEVISELRKVLSSKGKRNMPLAYYIDDGYVMVLSPCQVSIGGDQFGTTYVDGVSVTLAGVVV